MDRTIPKQFSVTRAQPNFQALLDAAPDAMVGVDPQGKIVMANVQTEELFGYRREELIGQPIEVLVPERVRAAHPAHRTGYFDHPRTRPMGVGLDLAGRRADGTEFPAEISLSAIDTDNDVLALAAIRDITDRKRIEADTRRAREEAERANRAKSDFLSRMSHELRTPLNSILGFGQILDLDELTEGQRGSVHQILRGGEHLLELINEILDISRIEAGHMTLSSEPVHLGPVLDETIQLVRPIAAQRGVLVEEPAGVTDVYVQADRQRIKQVFLNLLSNAVKYNREGGEVRLSCEVVEQLHRTSIIDTGLGISEENVDDLFKPFARLGADRLGIEGTGLGLALSKGLIENMEGRIGFSSQVGTGSTFWVELPLADRAEVEAAQAPPPGIPTATSAPARTVLYVEDNLANLQLIEAILVRRPSITLLSAMQGSLGMELARQHQPDLILLDLHLPDIPGEEALRRLRADPQTIAIPVLVITADASRGTADRLLEAGANGFLTKPVNVPQFLEAVDALLS